MNPVKQRGVLILGPDDYIAIFEPQVCASWHLFKRNSGGWGNVLLCVASLFGVGGTMGGGNGSKQEEGLMPSQDASLLLRQAGGRVSGAKWVRGMVGHVGLGGHDDFARRFRWEA